MFGTSGAPVLRDPKKIDILRRTRSASTPRFRALAAELGIVALPDHEIKTAADVAAWTDSICNASMPLPKPFMSACFREVRRIHHYPWPVAEIALFKYDLTDLTQQRRSDEEINRLAKYDSLTGLPNRMLMRRTLDEALQASRAGRRPAPCS